MWIMDFEGKNLADIRCFQIHKNLGGKPGKKWSIVGYTSHLAEATLTGAIICGYCADEEQAMAELERVAKFAEENPGKVYRFLS